MKYLKKTTAALLFSLVWVVGYSTIAAQIDIPGSQADFALLDEELVRVSSVLSFSFVEPGGTYHAAVVVAMEPGWHINSAYPYEDWLIPAELTFDTLAEITPFGVVYPQAHDVLLIDQKMSVYSDTAVVRFQIMVGADAEGEYVLPLQFTFQPCNNRECQAPQTVDADLLIPVGEEGEPIHDDIFSQTAAATDHDEAAAVSPEQEGEIQRLISEYGFWGYLIALGLAFVTGLVLSFSPCTYPMIPITVSIFAGQERSLGRGFVLSLFYVGSMAFMYGIMGLIVALVGGVFGAWLASTPVVVGIVVIFIVFSLSMFGLYEIQVPMSLRQKLGAKAGRGGVAGALVLGVIAALVVSPCVGPFVAGILLYVATSGSPVIGFLVLFVFALGLGTLYVIIATFSSAINKLPGSGSWMEDVNKFFGFVLLLMAMYFLRTILSPALTALITGLLLLAYGVFGGGLDRLTSEAGFFLRLKKFFGVIALLIGGYLFIGTVISQGMILPPASEWLPVGGSTADRSDRELIDWRHNLKQGLTQAKQEGKPVLIDTWATWCANCRVLDEKTFGNPRVAAEAERFVPIKVQLEKANTPTTKDFMARFGLRHYSLPTTLLLDSEGNVKKIMQGVVDPDDMIAEMQQVR